MLNLSKEDKKHFKQFIKLQNAKCKKLIKYSQNLLVKTAKYFYDHKPFLEVFCPHK